MKTAKSIFFFILLIWCNHVFAQDFDFQINEEGYAYYEDSVEVLNQDLDSAFIKISTWASGQVREEQDTLIFTQNSSSGILLKKILPVSPFKDGLSTYIFKLTILINLNSRMLRYKVDDIYHINLETGQNCKNLGMVQGGCEFEGDDAGWNRMRAEMDGRVRTILKSIEEFMSAK